MKTLKQIRENYDVVVEAEEAETRKLTSLVRAGLFDANKLPMMKRALNKDPKEMNTAERKVLLNLLDSLMSEVLHNQQVYSKVKQDVQRNKLEEAKTFDGYLSKYDSRSPGKSFSDRDAPAILILKRKAIRIYPDNQKVALYYSQALDKYVTVPFGAFGDGGVGLNEGSGPWGDRPTISPIPAIKPTPKPEEVKMRKFNGKKTIIDRKDEIYKKKIKTDRDYERAKTAVNHDTDLSLGQKAGIRVGMAARRAVDRFKEKRRTRTSVPSVSEGIVDSVVSSVAGAVSKGAAAVGRATKAVGKGVSNTFKDKKKDTQKSSPAPAPEKKLTQPKEFGALKVTTNAPKAQVRTAVDVRDVQLQRKSLMREGVLAELHNINENEEKTINIGESSISVNSTIAKKIIGVYESVNDQNKQKIETMLNESVDSFKKIVKFSMQRDI